MAKLKYVNSNNKSIGFGNTAPFLVLTVDGLGSPQNEIYTQKSPYQDGVTVIGSSLESRNIVIEGKIIDSNRANRQTYRNTLLSVFNPKLNGKLIVDLGSDQKQIDCKVEQAPYFSGESGQNHQDFSISLIAPNPYWKSPTIQEEPMAAFVELFEFPSDYWELGEDGDIYFEMGTEGHTRTFVNNGDGEVPIKIRIKGPTLNPTLTNLTTDELIKINRELSADDVLEISTEDGDKYILLNGENVFNWIDLSSTFWKLEVGENEIQYTADAGLESATLEITWQEQFVGV